MTAQQMIKYLKDEGTQDVSKFAGSIAENTNTPKDKVLELIENDDHESRDSDVAAKSRSRRKYSTGYPG